jgi:hypothetical protein
MSLADMIQSTLEQKQDKKRREEIQAAKERQDEVARLKHQFDELIPKLRKDVESLVNFPVNGQFPEVHEKTYQCCSYPELKLPLWSIFLDGEALCTVSACVGYEHHHEGRSYDDGWEREWHTTHAAIDINWVGHPRSEYSYKQYVPAMGYVTEKFVALVELLEKVEKNKGA